MNPVCFLFFCSFAPMPPSPVVPDGQGGFVPFTNSRVEPDGSLRSYDPAIDGVLLPDGQVYYPFAPYPEPSGHVEVGPPQMLPPPAPAPHRHVARPHLNSSTSHPCYGPDGIAIEPMPRECATQTAPPFGEPLPEPGRS